MPSLHFVLYYHAEEDEAEYGQVDPDDLPGGIEDISVNVAAARDTLQEVHVHIEEIAEELGVPVLGKMPIDQEIAEVVEAEKFYEAVNPYLKDIEL